MTGTGTAPVDPGNLEALRSWDGPDGDYWAEHERTFERSLHRYGPRLLAAAAVRRTDRILDVGCGTGGTSRELARLAPAGEVLGIDLSSRMLAVARGRSAEAGLANVRFLQGDAQVHPFEASRYDLVFSRNGTMFFADPVTAFANLGRALRRRGRLTMLVWQPFHRNEWLVELSGALAAGHDLPSLPHDAPGPFALADPARARHVLAAAGYTDVDAEAAEAPMWLGPTAAAADGFLRGLGFTSSMLQGLDDEARETALAALRALLDAHETADGVMLGSAAWIVTAVRP